MNGSYPNAHAKNLNNGFPTFSSPEIGSSLMSFQMIFKALKFDLFRFKSYTGFKNPKIPRIQPNDNVEVLLVIEWCQWIYTAEIYLTRNFILSCDLSIYFIFDIRSRTETSSDSYRHFNISYIRYFHDLVGFTIH